MIPPLAIIQARMGSTRLPGKMLLPLGGKPVIQWAWEEAAWLFGKDNVVIATTHLPSNRPLLKWARSVGAQAFAWRGREADVLGRLHACAHRYRTDLGSVVVRLTPDDFPVDVTRERVTLGWLDVKHASVDDPTLREHVGLLIPQRIEINTAADYEAARRRVGDA